MSDGPSALNRRQVEALESIAQSLEKIANPPIQIHFQRSRTRLQEILWEINQPKWMAGMEKELRACYLDPLAGRAYSNLIGSKIDREEQPDA